MVNESRKVFVTVLSRTVEICVWIFCFWLIHQIVVQYIHPEIPITPETSANHRNIIEFNNYGILEKQSGDTFFFGFLFCLLIAAYYCVLGVVKHKRKSRITEGNDKIIEQRKIIFNRLAVLFFLCCFIICGGIAVFKEEKKLIGLFIGALILFSCLGPTYIFCGLSKAYNFLFALKMVGCIVAVFAVCILLKIPPHFAPLVGALPFSKAFATKLDAAWKPFKL